MKNGYTKAEILAHFKDAKTVRCLEDGKTYNYNPETLHLYNFESWWCKDKVLVVLLERNGKLAEIVEYHSEAQHKIDLIKLAIKETPNDMELGAIIRGMEL